MDTVRPLIEIGASAIEVMTVALIVGAFFWATARFLVHTGRHATDPYQRYKLLLGKDLSLGLGFLVAADVIRTVILPPTLTNIGLLEECTKMCVGLLHTCFRGRASTCSG
jgi:uncharacterized membrane protein